MIECKIRWEEILLMIEIELVRMTEPRRKMSRRRAQLPRQA
jgi:hypothetical protein